MEPLPPRFVRNMAGIFGAEGQALLDALPDLLLQYAEKWSITIGPHFPNLSINYVAPATCADGTGAVLKLTVPNAEFDTEVAALRLWNGHGAVRLLETDNRGAFLIERARPGVSLEQAEEDAAISVAASVMQRLWRPATDGHPFPTVADWARGLEKLRRQYAGGTGPLPEDLVARAETLFTNLLATSPMPILLHGDLHHGNILSAEHEPWLAIDPKGVVGDPAFEVTAFMLNPGGYLDGPDPASLLAHRLDQFSELLGFDRERLRGWSIARAVLSAWWSIEDNGSADDPGDDWRDAITCARILNTL